MIQFYNLSRNEILQFESTGEENVLDLIEQNDSRFPSGCRTGVCGACEAVVEEGLDYFDRPSPIEEDTLQQTGSPSNHRLLCRARFKAGVSGVVKVNSFYR